MKILERDLEERLYSTPSLLNPAIVTGRANYAMQGWIARQMRVPSGRIDLLGMLVKYSGPNDDDWGPEVTRHPVIVELKRGAIDAAALAQVGRYLNDIRNIVETIEYTWGIAPTGRDLFAVIVGERADRNTILAARGLGVVLLSYDMQSLGPMQTIELCGRDFHYVAEGTDYLAEDAVFNDLRQEVYEERLRAYPLARREWHQ